MAVKRTKVAAVICIVLFLGYYQRWVYVPILEALQGNLSVGGPPSVPEIFLESLNNERSRINNNNNKDKKNANYNGMHEKGRRREEEEEGKDETVHTNYKKNAIKVKGIIDPLVEVEVTKLSQIIQRQLDLTQRGQNLNLMVRGCRQPKLICGAPIGELIDD
jgi:hypothetical protein